MRHLVRAFWNDATRTYVCCKASSEPSPCGLMIVWVLGRRASEICTWPYRSWRLPLRALRHRLWDSPCSETCRDMCDRIYPVKAFIIFRTSYFVCNFTQMLRSRTGEIQETHTTGPRIRKCCAVGPEKSRRPTQQARGFATTHAYMHFLLIACGTRHVHVR
jgi:hypothetical protein